MADSEIDEPRNTLPEDGLDLLFREARTHRSWQPKPIDDDILKQAYDLAKMGPTSVNSSPMRIVFVRTPEAKARLLPCLAESNRSKSETAAAIALIAYDIEFYELLPKLAPHGNAKAIFEGNDALIEETAFRNGSLGGAYFMLAARALGLDCGPMSGFDEDKLNAEFFADTTWRINFVCNLGYGDWAKMHERQPRLDFDEACRLL
jgi:3-hydroxypropanoate dehydrogenase